MGEYPVTSATPAWEPPMRRTSRDGSPERAHRADRDHRHLDQDTTASAIAESVEGPFPGGGPPETWPTGRLLSAAARRAERRWDTRLDPHQLSHASLPVLAILSAGPHSQRELAEMLGVTEQTVSRMLVRLEHQGYVERDVDPVDRRRRTVVGTAAGRRVLAEVSDTDTLDRTFTARLTDDEHAALRSLLLRLLEPWPEAQ